MFRESGGPVCLVTKSNPTRRNHVKIARKISGTWMFFSTMAVLLGWFSVSPTRVEAQQGDNAVCNSSSPPAGIKCSPAFIDASVITGSPNNDLCGKIYAVLNGTYPTNGAVIDARGITALTCASGTTPWNNGTSTLSKPSHILLPSGTITIPTTWGLPQGTRITGEGRGNTVISSTIPIGGFPPM